MFTIVADAIRVQIKSDSSNNGVFVNEGFKKIAALVNQAIKF